METIEKRVDDVEDAVYFLMDVVYLLVRAIKLMPGGGNAIKIVADLKSLDDLIKDKPEPGSRSLTELTYGEDLGSASPAWTKGVAVVWSWMMKKREVS